jgi:hypothetical protein
MPFNKEVKKLIVLKKDKKPYPCVMCGKVYPFPDAVHIIDEKEWKNAKKNDSKVNGIPLCPNCHDIFDEFLKPYLYKALKEFGSTNLPECWKKSNKMPEM